MKPRGFDAFCGAGGATRGYQNAGAYMVGCDIKPQPRYVGEEFIQGDALELLADLEFMAQFDFANASPPCQRFTRAQNASKNADAHPDLIAPTRELLQTTGLPYIIENVVGAPLIDPVTICGLSLGLGVRRHRLFESNIALMAPGCVDDHKRDYYVIFGHEVRNRRHGSAAGRKNKITEGRKAMGIDWMTRGELSEAIPPAYTELIGYQLMSHLKARTAA